MLQQVVYVLKFRRIKPAYMKCFLLTDIGEENSKLSGAKLLVDAVMQLLNAFTGFVSGKP